MGVQRQYSGTAGRVENCQVGVFLSYASSRGHTLLDRELYLPKSWTDDQERCREAHVPSSVTFATKPELARRMLERTLDAGLPVTWVTGDTVYGNHRPLRAYLEERQQAYALGISCQEREEVGGTRKRADQLALQIDAQAWQVLSCGEGSKGLRLYEWARLCTSDEVVAGWQQHLVIRRTLPLGAQPTEYAYFLVFARTGTTLQEMVQAIGQRWTIEQCFELGKGEVGLDEYEVRSWHGWYRHATLAMIALAFLTALRANEEEDVLKKSLSRLSRHRSQKQPTLLKHKCLLISRSWFPSVLRKSGGFSFISSENCPSLLPTTWPGHVGDARIKLSRGFVTTSVEALSLVIYNCRTSAPTTRTRILVLERYHTDLARIRLLHAC